MSTKAERARRKLKAQKAEAAQGVQAAQAANEENGERCVTFGVARIDGKDHIIRVGDYDSPQHLIKDDEAYVDRQHDEFMALIKSSGVVAQLAKKTGTLDENTPYMNFIKLYENGRALARFGLKPKDSPADDFERFYERLNDEFKERIEADYYDREFPEHAANANRLVQSALRNISAVSRVPVVVPEGAAVNPEYLTHVIRDYLQEAKQQIAKGDQANGMVGLGIEDGLWIVPIGLPEPRYRNARAISEVAAVINAPIIIQGGEVWIRDPKTLKRTGGEGVMVSVISPDGNVVASGSMTFHRNPLKFDEPEVEITADSKEKPKQFMFPKWAYFPKPSTLAA